MSHPVTPKTEAQLSRFWMQAVAARRFSTADYLAARLPPPKMVQPGDNRETYAASGEITV